MWTMFYGYYRVLITQFTNGIKVYIHSDKMLQEVIFRHGYTSAQEHMCASVLLLFSC